MLHNLGMGNKHKLSNPLPPNRAARCLCVPARWLRDEFEAGRLPGLQAGRTILIHVPTVAELLAQRAKAGASLRLDSGEFHV